MPATSDQPTRTGIGDGISAFFGGALFVVTTPRVWPLALVPAVILTALWTAFAALGIWGAVELSGLLISPPRGTWGEIGYWTLNLLFSALAILLAALIALALAQPLSGPALERISIVQERQLTGGEPAALGILHSVWVSVKALFLALALGGSAIVLLFLIGLLFPPAAIVTVPLKFLVGAWMLAWDCLDYPLGLRGLGVRDRIRWVQRNATAFTAFGLLGAVFTVVPGAVLLLLPVGVAGATRLLLKDDPRLGPQ